MGRTGLRPGWRIAPVLCPSLHSAEPLVPPALPSPAAQHKNPSVFRDQQIRLRKPDGNLIKNMVPLPACKDIHLPDNGAVGCGYNYYRPGLTPQL